MSDTRISSRPIRILAVIGDFTCESLALDPPVAIRRSIAGELGAIIAARDRLLMAASENGTELVTLALLR